MPPNRLQQQVPFGEEIQLFHLRGRWGVTKPRGKEQGLRLWASLLMEGINICRAPTLCCSYYALGTFTHTVPFIPQDYCQF